MAVAHLAGWLHVPREEIRVVSITLAQVPSDAKTCRVSAELVEPAPEERLITLEARGKKYGYYISGEALLLCPVLLP